MSITAPAPNWTTRNKVGLGLAIFYGITNIPAFLAPSGGENEPPLAILIVGSVLGLVATVAGVIAWRQRSRSAARLTAVSVIVITLTALPAFFVDTSAGVKALVTASVLLTVVIVVLMFSADRTAAKESR